MARAMRFDKVLEAVDRLSPVEQDELVDLVRRRSIERRRDEIAADVREAEGEFRSGGCKTASVSEIMDEIQS